MGTMFVLLGGIMVYSMFVNVEEAHAGEFNNEDVYFFHEDHIGRPLFVTELNDSGSNGFEKDASGDYYWNSQYNTFGSVQDYNSSVGITIGNTGTTGIVWDIPFRFPGQYEDPAVENGRMFYNRYRFYIPSIGRYNQFDPQGSEDEHYAYATNNPVAYYDPNGLDPLNSIPENAYYDSLLGKIKQLNKFAHKNDCLALVEIVKFAGSQAKNKRIMYETLLKIAEDGQTNEFGDSCFKDKFKDGHMQVRHSLGALWAGYKYGYIFGTLGSCSYEIFGPGTATAGDWELGSVLPSLSGRLNYRVVWKYVQKNICKDTEKCRCKK